MIQISDIVKMDSKCADGSPCWLRRRYSEGEGLWWSIQLGTREIHVPDEDALDESVFMDRIKERDTKDMITPELESELARQFRRLRGCCDRDEIHDVTDYDS